MSSGLHIWNAGFCMGILFAGGWLAAQDASQGSTSAPAPAVNQSAHPPATPSPGTPERPFVPQRMSRRFLRSSPLPEYPKAAKEKRIQGAVVVKVDIAKDGSVETATLVSGDPQLAPAAIQAVKKWKFRPFTTKGQPVEVATQVVVPFVLPQEQPSPQQPSPDSAQPPQPPQ